MRYYLIAGERSGDLHGGNLIRAIGKNDPEAKFRGFGGENMQAAGMELVMHYRDMAFMGFLEVLKNLRTISRIVRKCRADILEQKPDVIILIDYAGFNRQIAGFAKKKKFTVFYYITPKVWAWHQRRALQLKANVDRMFVILPFEKDFFKKYDWDVDYVGNPVLDAVKAHQRDDYFFGKNKLVEATPLIALLPGSRKQELDAMMPVLAEVVKKFPEMQFGVAAVNSLEPNLYQPLTVLPNVTLIVEDTYNLLLNARAAIVTSGTATLETALFRVPQAVVYRTSALTYRVVKLLIRVEFISLVNLIAGREVIKELIQHLANPDDIAHELRALTSDEKYRARIMKDYEGIFNTLDTGSASENAGRLMVRYLKNENKKG
jgi:lipid-A-disaccharide synthase